MTTPPTEPPSSEAEILRKCTDLLRDRLPENWRVSVQQEQDSMDRRIDAVLTVADPSGEKIRYLVEAKRLLVRRDIPVVSERLRNTRTNEMDIDNTRAMVMSRYLAPSIREALAQENMSFIDATSNMLVQSSRPALFRPRPRCRQ